MATPAHSIARTLLDKAHQDARTLGAQFDDGPLDECIFGFHAQQAVEKAIKAVLSIRAVPFPRTHDLVGLHDLTVRSGIALPIACTLCDELNPFAVETRYGIIPAVAGGTYSIPRAQIQTEIAKVLAWAELEVGP